MSDHHHLHDHDHDHGEHVHTHAHEHTHSHTHDGEAHSHPHTHAHTHSHGEHAENQKESVHGHTHGATHDHEHPQPMDIAGKLKVLAEHWLGHNADHAQTYVNWAEQAKDSGLKAVSETLREVAKQTENLNTLFEKIKKQL